MEEHRRGLPWEILVLVFEASSPSTLAVLGGVSLDFLIATSKILYGRVEIRTLKGLEGLFSGRDRETKSLLRINSYLSLLQVKSLTLDFSSLPDSPSTPLSSHLDLDFARTIDFDGNPPLLIPLDKITIILNTSNRETLLPLLHLRLLPHLNPLHVAYELPHRSGHLSSPWSDVRSPHLENWTRVESVSFRGVLSYSYQADSSQVHPASLPFTTLARLDELRLYLDTLLHHGQDFLGRLEKIPVITSLEHVREGGIVLVVASEEERTETMKAVQMLSTEGLRTKFTVVSES
ncbi:hypothetical protein BDY24DRAFT_439276 [Mrakia frigida]|uniref:uncharacterized protein n=1 Tax=Mrakia frigida TaxID=29902 RepID=UPI003FCC20D5